MKKYILVSFFLILNLFAKSQSVQSLKDYFGNEKFTIIGEQLNILLDNSVYPLDNQKYIMFYFEYKQVKVAKKIGFIGQTISIKKSDFSSYKNKAIDLDSISPVKIYYRDESNGKVDLITTVSLHFVNNTILENDFSIIKNIYSKQNTQPDIINETIRQYFTDIYGKTDQKQLDSIIHSNL